MLDKTVTETIEIPSQFAGEVKLLVNLLLTGEINSLSNLLVKAGYSSSPKLFDQTNRLNELWEKVISLVEPPTTKSLLIHKCSLLSFEGSHAVIGISSPSLSRLLESKMKKIEQAFSDVIHLNVTVELAISPLSPPPQIQEKQPRKPDQFTPLPQHQETTLTPDQETALYQLQHFTNSSSKFFRLTGYAGTGKSFLITHYIRWLIDSEINFVAASPTNKAAKNLKTIASVSGLDIEVKTVAQLLGQQPELDEETGKEFFLSKDNLDWSGYGVIIIDEFSMVNKSDFQDIVYEINSSLLSKVVFVGDSAQLPPVGETESVVSISPLIKQEATLTKVVRYDGELAQIAETIRSNSKYSRILFPFQSTSDRSIICLSESEWLNKAHALMMSKEFSQNPDLVRFLAWRNKTVESLNHFVRSQFWGEDAPDYLPGDRLIARRPLFRPKPGAKGRNKWRIIINNSEEAQVIQPGFITSLSFRGQIYKYWKVEVMPDMGSRLSLSILHPDSKKIHREQVEYFISKKQWLHYYDLSRMFDDVGYAYALTTHKAQGSTIDYVFLDVEDIKGCSDRQKLVYTALTRARTQVLIPN